MSCYSNHVYIQLHNVWDLNIVQSNVSNVQRTLHIPVNVDTKSNSRHGTSYIGIQCVIPCSVGYVYCSVIPDHDPVWSARYVFNTVLHIIVVRNA